MKFILVLIMMVAGIAHASSPNLRDLRTAEPAYWGGNTVGHEHEIMQRQARRLWTMLKMPMKCRAAAYGIAERLYNYDELIDHHRDLQANESVGWIKRTLRSQTDCFQSVSVFYALAAGGGLYFIRERSSLLLDLYSLNKLKAVRSGKSLGGSKILGAYDCSLTTIYFDPVRGPYDLRDIMLHELKHLVRDKHLGTSDLELPKTKLTAIEYAITDETLATIAGALTELEEQDKRQRDFDLSLFNDNGSLVGSIRHVNRGIAEPGDFVIRPSYSIEDYMPKVGAKKENEAYLRKIISLVASVYAPNAHYRTDKIIRWIREYNFADEHFLEGHDFETSASGAKSGGSLHDAVLENPSRMCRAFQQQIKKGELRDYLGTKVKAPTQPGSEGTKPGAEGTKPGSEGTKPGSEGTKPGSEGTKPGSEGTKPGSEGTKPGSEGTKPLSTLRPCVDPAPGF